MTTLNFNQYDSWALWNVPSGLEKVKDRKEAEDLFKEAHQSNHFPMEQLPTNLEKALSEVKYVFIGLNPGNAGSGSETSDTPFLNFHGETKSCDYRLAAALYGTDMWGAFMTDLVHINESDSRMVNADQGDVAFLENHLDELGIPADAVLVAMGTTSFDTLKSHAKRPVRRSQHYSGSNGHWGKHGKPMLEKIINEFA